MNNERFIIKLADKNIDISCLYPSSKSFCEKYLTNGGADFNINISQADIDYEKNRSVEHFGYDDSYFETLAIYRKIADKMIDYNTVLLHASAIAVNNEAYLFIAKSGTGKSTHTKLWCEYLKNQAVMINDDKPLVRIHKDKIDVFGTPWDGKHHISNNISAPLKAICTLEQGLNNSITKQDRKTAYKAILSHSYRPTEKSGFVKYLELLDNIVGSVDFYKLICNKDISSAILAYNEMKG